MRKLPFLGRECQGKCEGVGEMQRGRKMQRGRELGRGGIRGHPEYREFRFRREDSGLEQVGIGDGEM